MSKKKLNIYLSVSWVFDLKFDEKSVNLILQIDSLEHGDHASVTIKTKISSPLRWLLKSERLIRQIPIVGIFNVDSADLSIGCLAFVIVYEYLTVSRCHGVIVDIADGQQKLAHAAQVLKIANLDGNLVAFLLFAIKIYFCLQNVATIAGLLDDKPSSDVRVSSSVNLKGERWSIFFRIIIISDQFTHHTRVLVLRPD